MIKIDLTAKYVLAVSGGADSMVMLHMFASLSPRPDFSVVTVNHNIRAEAHRDCDFVENYCNALNVVCRKVFVDVPLYAEEHNLSTETAARILRYGVLDCQDCDYVCLAHHAGDNAETVLMHILRGSGAQGATGIRPSNGKYLRPLLDMSKEQIEQYARLNKVPYVNDVTNDETKYTRNFIRHNVLPLLKRLNPNAEQNIARFAENIAEDCGFLESLADISQVEFGAGYARIPKELFNLPKPVMYRTVIKVFNRLNVYKDIEKAHINALLDLANGVGGRRINLPFGFVATNDYDFVTIERSQNIPSADFEIPFAEGKAVTPLGIVEISKTQKDGALMFDYDKIPKGAVLRLKREGDVFTKFGGGSKSLKKYLIDKKIPQRLRSGLVLVASGNEIYIICGVEISNKVKVDGTSNAYYISLIKEGGNEIL